MSSTDDAMAGYNLVIPSKIRAPNCFHSKVCEQIRPVYVLKKEKIFSLFFTTTFFSQFSCPIFVKIEKTDYLNVVSEIS